MALEEYRKKVADLSINEQKLRDLYLRDLALGKIQGPPTGYASLDKPWLKYYSEDCIEQDVPKMKAYDYLVLNNHQHLDSNALNYFGKKITYRELFENIDKVAKSLLVLGVRPGDIVTIASANTPETVYLFYALNKIGAISNMIDPRNSAIEIRDELNKVNSEYFIYIDIASPSVKDAVNGTHVKKCVSVSALESLPRLVKFAASLNNKKENINIHNNMKWCDFIKLGSNYKGEIENIYSENMPITLVHTGGTTGVPKGVVLTNENFVTMANMHLHGDFDYEKHDKFLNILPPFIAYCLCNGINMPLSIGLEVTLVPAFEPQDFPKLLDKYKPNHVLSGPILWEYVLKSDIKDMSYLKNPVSGGDALSLETELKINEFLKSKGCKVKLTQGYGMSEVSSAVCYSYERANVPGSVGIPFVKNNISVFDPDTLEEKTYGEEGEIWISTKTAMLNYYNNDIETQNLKVFKDGQEWIRTSDIGKILPNGSIVVIGRMKRMIVRSGNKIFPSNVENLVLQNDNIESCAMVGVPDEKERMVPVLHVILKDDCSKDYDGIVEEVDDLIKSNLPEFNIPKKYVFRDEMPLTNINKVDFRSLEKEELSDSRIVVKRNVKVKKYEEKK